MVAGVQPECESKSNMSAVEDVMGMLVYMLDMLKEHRVVHRGIDSLSEF